MSKQTIFDLAILGGGPAGSSSAIVAARNEARVILLERSRFPRHRVCGEFVSAESIGLLRSLLGQHSPNVIANAPLISQTRLFLDGKVLRGRIDPAAASITRFDLDQALWNACRFNGVEARSEIVAQRIEGQGPFRVVTNAGTFDAKAIINATGRWSNFTSAATRARLDGRKWIGLKAHFYEAAPYPSVDLYFFDGGYCGVTQVGVAENGSSGVVNACAMVRSDVASTIADVLAQHQALFERSREWSAASEPVSTSPLVFHEPEPVQDSMLQVGDAATFVDPFVGDGISLALRSGALAAECLVPFFREECSLHESAARYARAYHQRLSHVFKASSRIRSLLRWPRAVRRPALSVLARAPFITSQIVKMTR